MNALLLLPSLAFAAAEAPAPLVRPIASIEWKASGSLPPGAEYHLVYEDPKTHAIQAYVRMPRGYALPAHTHQQDETILVTKGKLVLGFGERTNTVAAGDYAVIPAGTPFTLKAEGFGGAQFLASFNGPFDFKPVEPKKP